MNAEAFFGSIATRLGRPWPRSVAPDRDVLGAPDFWMVPGAHSADPVETFKRELEALGDEVHVLSDAIALKKALGARLSELSPERVECWGGNFLRDYEL